LPMASLGLGLVAAPLAVRYLDAGSRRAAWLWNYVGRAPSASPQWA